MTMKSASSLRYPSTLISFKGMSFLIIDAPVDTSLPQYIVELRKYNARHLVRACEPTYHSQPLVEAGIQIHELPFADGEPPPKKVIEEWLKLVDEVFELQRPKKTKEPAKEARPSVTTTSPTQPIKGDVKNMTSISPQPVPDNCIAVHCQAGLGRAPALVAIALMQRGGLAPLDAILYIRERRKGAFNAKQIAYLEAYKTHNRKKSKGCCCIS